MPWSGCVGMTVCQYNMYQPQSNLTLVASAKADREDIYMYSMRSKKVNVLRPCDGYGYSYGLATSMAMGARIRMIWLQLRISVQTTATIGYYSYRGRNLRKAGM